MRYLLCLLTAAGLGWSAPAFPGGQTFTLPDGSSFTGRMQGDEFLHWIETEKGEMLLFSKERRRFEHARIEAGKFMPSGLPFVPGADSPLPQPDREELYRIWNAKRSAAFRDVPGFGPKGR